MLIYLDMNIYNRIFDDQTQMRIKSETDAIEKIFDRVSKGEYKLYSSYMLLYENNANKSNFRRFAIHNILTRLICISPNLHIDRIAMELLEATSLKQKDALHLACAIYSKCQYFITCDDNLLKTVLRNFEKLKELLECITLVNPVKFIQNEV